MRRGVKGNFLPESQEDFQKLVANGGLSFHGCVSCNEPFSNDNTHTSLGWAETQISGMCEDCFDQLFKED